MDNMLTYLKWRGDIPFHSSPFNEVDNLILSEFIYFDFSDIISDSKNTNIVTIEEAYLKYKHKQNRKNGTISKNDELLFKELAKSKRFSQCTLDRYVDVLDDTNMMTQFAVIEINLSNDLSYISFRGTDDTLIGWKEDFSFSYEISHAEKLAHEYLEETIEHNRSYYVGGHSKGGHLAVYSTLMCDKELQDRILRVYSNDGPGVCFDIISKEKYQCIENKVIKFVPQFSIVGMLFEQSHMDNISIVKSCGKGFMQHDTFTWNIEGTQISKSEKFDKMSSESLHIINGFLEESSLEQKRVFVESLFQSISDKGFKTFDDISTKGNDAFLMLLKSVTYSSKESGHILSHLIKRALTRLKAISFKELFKTQKLYFPILIFFSGVLFISTPHHALRIIGTFFFTWLLFYSIFQLYKLLNHKSNKSNPNKHKILFYGIIIVFELFCIIQGSLILISSNIVLAGLLFWRAYKRTKTMIHAKIHKKKSWIVYLFDSILVCIMAIVAIYTTADFNTNSLLFCGLYLIIIGMVEIGNTIYFNEKKKYGI